MRSPGVVYRRYRQLKKKILYDKVEKARLCIFENCHYGKMISYLDDNGKEQFLKVCNYNTLFDQGTIEICTNPGACNAYVNKWTKDKIIQEIGEDLKDHDKKKKLYPELILLEWVLDKDLNDAIKNPGIIGSFLVKCIEFLENILRKL